jgi:hypothetical protein
MLTPELISEDLAGFFHASQIATAINGAVCIDLGEEAALAHRRLTDARFDQAPVLHENRPVGWVATARLENRQTVKAVMMSLDKCVMISAESSIASILQLVHQHKFLFVVGKQGISGFIVQSDLDRHAVRSYFYLLISSIEMLLSEIVKSVIPENQVVIAIRPNEKKRYDQAQIAGQDTNPVEYLYIKQLIELFHKTPYACNPDFWNESLGDQLLKIKSFRNTVMHATSSIAATDNLELAASLPGWAGEVTRGLRGILAAVNIQTTEVTARAAETP